MHCETAPEPLNAFTLGVEDHRVRIPRVRHPDFEGTLVDSNRAPAEAPNDPHFDGDGIKGNAATQRSSVRLDEQLAATVALCDVAGDASQTIATHLGDGTVSIEDAHSRLRGALSRREDEEDAVGSDAPMTIADCNGIDPRARSFVRGLEDHEVVAEPLVFREGQGAHLARESSTGNDRRC
jgi:hypothetical protein